MGKEITQNNPPPGLLGNKVFSWLMNSSGLSLRTIAAIALVIVVISILLFVKMYSGENDDQKVEVPKSDSSTLDEIADPLFVKDISTENLDYTTGDESKTCAWQEFEACQPEEFCSQNQWAHASNTRFCCSTSCVERIQTKNIPVEGIRGATITVEKFDGGYAVWWGTSSFDTTLDISIIGHESYVETIPQGGNTYSFRANNQQGEEQKFFITIIDKGTFLEAVDDN